MKHSYTPSDRDFELFFDKLMRDILEALHTVEEMVGYASREGWLDPDWYEVVVDCLQTARFLSDQAFKLPMARLDLIHPDIQRPWPARGKKALLKRVRDFAADEKTAGVLRFIGYDQALSDEGTSE